MIRYNRVRTQRILQYRVILICQTVYSINSRGLYLRTPPIQQTAISFTRKTS